MKTLGTILLILGAIVGLLLNWIAGAFLAMIGLLLMIVGGQVRKEPPAVICGTCGNPVARTANLCPTCGARLSPTEGPLAPPREPVVCSICGKANGHLAVCPKAIAAWNRVAIVLGFMGSLSILVFIGFDRLQVDAAHAIYIVSKGSIETGAIMRLATTVILVGFVIVWAIMTLLLIGVRRLVVSKAPL